MQDAITVEYSFGYDVGGPGEISDREKGEGCGGGDELGVRGWSKEAAFVQSVERLAVEGGYTDAELCVAQGWVRENGVDASGQSLRDGAA